MLAVISSSDSARLKPRTPNPPGAAVGNGMPVMA